MFIIVDERNAVTEAYASRFGREGVASIGFSPADFQDWVETAQQPDIGAVEAFLLGDCSRRDAYPKIIRERSRAPVIAMSEAHSLETTLELFAAGVDDVVRKPVHIREIMARVEAIRRRTGVASDHALIGDMRVYFDGRDPEIKGEVLPLPRRERRILEFLVRNQGRRVTKTQIFNSIYGIFDEDVEENVVESHVSKLRKKLRHRLGYDPIESKRYLGYRLQAQEGPPAGAINLTLRAPAASRLQPLADLLGEAVGAVLCAAEEPRSAPRKPEAVHFGCLAQPA